MAVTVGKNPYHLYMQNLNTDSINHPKTQGSVADTGNELE